MTVNGEFLNTVKLRCISPPQATENDLVNVEVSFNLYDWTNSGVKFLYLKTPVIYSLFPLSGPSTGGTMISLIGANFTGEANPDEFLCRFTTVSIKPIRRYVPGVYKNDNLVYCTMPGGWGVGTEVKIDITFNGLDYTSSDLIFNVFQIDDTLPRSGPTSGSLSGITTPPVSCKIKKFKPLR